MRSTFNKAALAVVIVLFCTSCMAQPPYVRLKGETFSVEIADNPEKQQLGLMFRDSMPRDQGMLFIFPNEAPRSFWMKNTRIALDIIYFDQDLRLVNAVRARPCRTQECPGYPSDGPAMYVLELNAGLAEELALAAGDRMEVKLLAP
jgi:uncharacterized membrane protein (UPF0127 family)